MGEAAGGRPRASSLSRLLQRLLLTSACLLACCCCCTRCHGDAAGSPTDAGPWCPEGCRCVPAAGLVNCSNGPWTYIPTMPSFARSVRFENNSLHHIDSTTLSNLTVSGAQIHSLSLSGNRITTFAGNSFTQLTNLQRLWLERVSHNYSMFQEVFGDLNKLVHLEMLSLSRNRLPYRGHLPQDFFGPLENSSLSRLYLKMIDIAIYDHDDFLPLRNLQHLDLGSNVITEAHLATSDTLEILDLSYNRMVYLPHFCHNKSHPHVFFKNLRILSLNANLIYKVYGPKFSCLSELRNISLAMNVVGRISRNTFAHLPKLDSVFLYSMRINWLSLSHYAFNNSNLKSVLLFNNRINFLNDVSEEAFYGCSNLQFLDIAHNFLHKISRERFTKMFRTLTKLKFLRMESCRLDSLPPDFPAHFPSLEILKIDSNEIVELERSWFQGLTQLKTLNASHNKIQSLDEESFRPVFDRLEHINLADNPYYCDCRLLWFKEYLQANASKFFYAAHGYTCSTPPAFQRGALVRVALSQRTCLVPHDVSLVLVACCSLLVVATVAAALGWRYRWHLHFLLLVLERRHSRRRPAALTHDYYVSADLDSETDRPWVLRQLMPRLAQFGLRACSAEDTTPGQPELSSALSAMLEHCQRVLFVVSDHYAQSGRCQFELSLALKASLELQRQDITVILLEPVAARHVSRPLQVLLQEFPCLPWPSESADLEGARRRFWDTLRSALAPAAERQDYTEIDGQA